MPKFSFKLFMLSLLFYFISFSVRSSQFPLHISDAAEQRGKRNKCHTINRGVKSGAINALTNDILKCIQKVIFDRTHQFVARKINLCALKHTWRSTYWIFIVRLFHQSFFSLNIWFCFHSLRSIHATFVQHLIIYPTRKVCVRILFSFIFFFFLVADDSNKCGLFCYCLLL